MILDTNAISALFEADARLVQLLSSAPKHEIPTIVIGEYRYGLARSRLRKTIVPMLDGLVAKSTVLAITASTAVIYAETRERLRAAGTPVGENDVWISALALEHGLEVVSRDTDFDRVAGLRRRAW